jgi:sodium transport system permease protein
VIVGGKWLAATFTSVLSVLLTTAIILAMLRFIPMQEFGVRFRLHPEQIGLLLGAVLPITLLASGVQTYLATFAKSFKEAQSYMGLLIILPMLPGFAATLYPMTGQPWMYPIPVIAQQVLAGDVVAARDTPWWAFVVAAGSALILSLLLLVLTTRLMQKERIIFTR